MTLNQNQSLKGPLGSSVLNGVQVEHDNNNQQETVKGMENPSKSGGEKRPKLGEMIENFISTGLAFESSTSTLLQDTDAQNPKHRSYSVDETMHSSPRFNPGAKRRCFSMDDPQQKRSTITESVPKCKTTDNDNSNTLSGSSLSDTLHEQSHLPSHHVISDIYTGTLNITLQTPIKEGTFADKQKEFLKRFLKNASVRDLIKKQLDQIPKGSH